MLKDYCDFQYWTVGGPMWRIQFPGGHKTPPIRFTNEEAVKSFIDNIVIEAAAKNAAEAAAEAVKAEAQAEEAETPTTSEEATT